MNILVVGAHFYNKGAHLMMIAVLEELNKHSDITLFLSPTTGTKEQIADLGYRTIDYPLKHVADEQSFGAFLNYGGLIKLLKKKFRGELKLNKIDAVLDISGFAFSDQWGSRLVENVNSLIKFFKKRGVKYIFLPQAFGPFTGAEIRAEMKEVLNTADLILARDKVSFEMLKSISNGDTIQQYPDITIGLKSKSNYLEAEQYCCIVPNERMVDQGKEYWAEGKYIGYLKSAIQTLVEKEHTVYILLHDKGTGDVNLVNFLKESFKDTDLVKVRAEEDPMKLKAFLGGARLVVGSRFHALVSALSQNVPSLALGWSHKYDMLFEEYEIEDFSFTKPNDAHFKKCLENLMNEKEHSQIQQRISGANEVLIEKNKKMWSEVLAVLKT